MKGMSMDTPWRTVQVFISAQNAGVFEVEVDTETKETRCSCPAYSKRGTCKHTNFVNLKMKLNNGHYAILVPNEVPEDWAVTANDNPEAFRTFVLKYGKIEVL